MSDVYRNAGFTIAATQADQEKGLIISKRRFARPVDMQIEVPQGFFGYDAGTLHCRVKQENDGDANLYLERFADKGLLYSRAWVLQEQALSCRLLSFTRNELHFECLEKECTESIPEGWPSTAIPDWVDKDPEYEEFEGLKPRVFDQGTSDRSAEDNDGSHKSGDEDNEMDAAQFEKFSRGTNRMAMMRRRRIDYIQTLKRGIGRLTNFALPSSQEEFHFAWYLLVENYSRRSITYNTDRLMALAGIANTVGQATGNTFVAGLWKEHLWRDLLWTTTYSHWEMGKGEPSKRPELFACPSWTWASVLGYIKYTHNEFDSFKDHKLFVESLEVILDGEDANDTVL